MLVLKVKKASSIEIADKRGQALKSETDIFITSGGLQDFFVGPGIGYVSQLSIYFQ